MNKPLIFISSVFLAASTAQAAVLVHGHRGTRGTRAENTLPAFNEALCAGVDALELDLGVSKDGVVVVSHEPGVNPAICLAPDGKKMEKPALFRDLTLEEIKKYDCGARADPGFSRQVPVPGARIPTLAEVYFLVETSTCPAAARVEFNIETKIFAAKPALTPPPAEFAALVAAVVKRHAMEKRTIVQSFDVRTLREIKKLAPALRTSRLTDKELADIVPALKRAKIDIWSPNYLRISEEAVREAHAAGIQVVPWTINSAKGWEAAIAAGVDAIITDYPADLITYLKKNKLR